MSWLISHIHVADVPFQVLVVVLAFLLGSFLARNTDIWTTLATGRLFLEAKYAFGTDPFSYMTEAQGGQTATRWVNHSWFYSGASYFLYEFGGSGTILVVCKALLLAWLAAFLLRARPKNRHGWARTWCVLLIVLVVSTGALLQPVVFSYVFLAVLLKMLKRAGVFNSNDVPAQPRWLWGIPILFLFWINLDDWFILGPLVLMLTLITVTVAQWFSKSKSAVGPAKLGAVLAVSLLACLANPYHYRALLTTPPEFGQLLLRLGNFWPESLVAGARTFAELQRLGGQTSISLLSTDYWTQTQLGKNVAGVSLLVLAALLVLSFYFCRPVGAVSLAVRAVLAGFFAILALAQARLAPFFAIAGGMVLMWNVQEYLGRREASKPALAEEHDRWANAARLAMGFALFGLLFLAWPGWVNYTLGDPASPRRVAWGIEDDPSLKNAAKFLHSLHATGGLKRGFNLTTDLASYCAFHAPDLKFFMDQRAALFDRTAPVANRIRKALAEESESVPLDPFSGSSIVSLQGGWRNDLSRYGIDYLAGTGDLAKQIALWTMLYPRGELETIYADGQTYVIAWSRGFQEGKSFKAKRQEITQRWRGEVFDEREGSWPAPVTPLYPGAGDPGFWKNYAVGARPTSPAARAAKFLLDVHTQFIKTPETIGPPWPAFAVCASMAGYWAVPTGVASGPAVVYTFPALTASFAGYATAAGSDQGMPAALLLALRTVRKALADDPDDADCQRLLALVTGQADNALEAYWVRPDHSSNLRTALRKCQFVAALQQYLLLNHADFNARWALGIYFRDAGFFDLAAKEFDESIKWMAGLETSKIKDLRSQREREAEPLKQLVEERQREFALETAGMSDVEKVARAAFLPYQMRTPDGKVVSDSRGMGLTGKAWEILNELIDRWQDLPQAEQQQLTLFFVPLALKIGQIEPADKIVRAAKQPLDLLFLSAAESDLRQADEALALIDRAAAKDEPDLQKRAAQSLATALLAPTEPGAVLTLAPAVFPQALGHAGRLIAFKDERARHVLLRGLFSLEAGRTIGARHYFLETLRISAGLGETFTDGKIARRYLQLLGGN